jgi:hypothetical protein
MKKILYSLIILLFTQSCIEREFFSFNKSNLKNDFSEDLTKFSNLSKLLFFTENENSGINIIFKKNELKVNNIRLASISGSHFRITNSGLKYFSRFSKENLIIYFSLYLNLNSKNIKYFSCCIKNFPHTNYGWFKENRKILDIFLKDELKDLKITNKRFFPNRLVVDELDNIILTTSKDEFLEIYFNDSTKIPRKWKQPTDELFDFP